MFTSNPFYRTPYNLDRAQAIAAQRAKRAQWLPDEYDDGDFDDHGYNMLSPPERAYLDAHRRQVLMEQERNRQRELEIQKRAEEERRWQDALDRRQKEDETARRKLQEEKEKRRQGQNLRPHSRSRSPSRQIPIHDSHPPASSEKPPSPEQRQLHDSEMHQQAATKIQQCFRTHRSLQSIQDIHSQFETLRSEFVYPSIITFQEPSSSNTIDVPSSSITPSDDVNIESPSSFPKLAFNSTNYNLHAYNESLEKLLVKLDGVESWGDSDVRTKRRSVVKSIEKEQGRVDRFCQDVWLKHIQDKKADGDITPACQ
ncbi:hypothetical protein Agabi119p4_11416 [Agaricus bisporus var. burnettii]|uniref:BAG domain-containing protein n=1 Tax=Agaricus bisporus var. burnettii TaxID=192524 RepID=A0A8H7BY67_AGABI|nr:hypothetical protein Agabi119p4_11416 [Agaricus bisporus var. burnettii]